VTPGTAAPEVSRTIPVIATRGVCAAPSVRIIASQSEPIGIAVPHNRGTKEKGPEGMTPAGPEICEWCAVD
jgi:hypothetical protein